MAKKKSNKKEVKKSEHKCTRFLASQVCYVEVEVDLNNDVMDTHEITESEEPTGPFICMDCNKTYDSLPKDED